MNFFAWIGRHFIDTVLYITDLIYFMGQIFAIWQPQRNVFNNAIYFMLLSQLIFTGIDAVFTIFIFAILIGVGVTSQLVYIMHTITGASDITEILARFIISELSPLITGVILVGRSCAAIVVDLGNAKARNEIKSLEYFGIDVNDYLVIPRVISVMICQVILALYFSIIMILSGVYFSAFFYSFSAQESFTELINTLSFNTVIVFMIKNCIFGFIIGSLACFHGLAVENSMTQVPQQTQKAMVRSFMFLFIVDGYFMIFFL